MRNQFVETIKDLMVEDESLFLMLGDIGVYGFRDVLENYPKRAYNIGICEQATVSIMAGLSISGFTPVFHSIAPFLVERAYEQIKIDFAYQRLGGNFVSVGGSFEYDKLGATHHCPADVAILNQIPGMQIVVPGTAKEFDILFRESYDNNQPTYFRLGKYSNSESYDVRFGLVLPLNGTGREVTVLATGPALRWVEPLIGNQKVSVLYCTTVSPLDIKTIRKYTASKLIVVEPYYTAILPQIVNSFFGVEVYSVCPDKEFVDVGFELDEMMKDKLIDAIWRLA